MSDRLRPCSERDNIVLAYLLAVNHLNELTSRLEELPPGADDPELRKEISGANDRCQELRTCLTDHCLQHAC